MLARHFSSRTHLYLGVQITDEDEGDAMDDEGDLDDDGDDDGGFELPVVDAADLELTGDIYLGMEDIAFEGDDDDDSDWYDE